MKFWSMIFERYFLGYRRCSLQNLFRWHRETVHVIQFLMESCLWLGDFVSKIHCHWALAPHGCWRRLSSASHGRNDSGIYTVVFLLVFNHGPGTWTNFLLGVIDAQTFSVILGSKSFKNNFINLNKKYSFLKSFIDWWTGKSALVNSLQ